MEAIPGGVVIESRIASRCLVEVECAVLCDVFGQPVSLRATDLSEDGMWVETELPLDVGTEVALAFAPPKSQRSLYIAGEVRHVKLFRRNSDPRRAGMGIEFRGLRASDRQALSSTLRSIESILPPTAEEKTETLPGVPIAQQESQDRRLSLRDTVNGLPAPKSDSVRGGGDRRRRRAKPPALPKQDSETCFNGGLAFASSLFASSLNAANKQKP